MNIVAGPPQRIGISVGVDVGAGVSVGVTVAVGVIVAVSVGVAVGTAIGLSTPQLTSTGSRRRHEKSFTLLEGMGIAGFVEGMGASGG
jgi:hypothetical protein